MITRPDFLRTVLPPTGLFCALGIKGKKGPVITTFHESIEELDERLAEVTKQKLNAYFGLAAFSDPDGGRTQDNSKTMRALFFDLDCGPIEEDEDPEEAKKKYPSQADALLALRQLVKDLKLPTPWLVDSGKGIHVYWPFTEAVPKEKWKPVADKLKLACQLKGFVMDFAVPADSARVLRAPGSFHVKDVNNPLPVQVIKQGTITPFDELRKLLGVSEFETALVKRPMDEVTKNLLANRPSVFKDIIKKSVAGEGCNQILYAITHQASVSEPQWRGVLSVAQHCVDRDTAIHKVSNQHPDYDPNETEKKASATKGPYTCTSFQNIDMTLCEGCPHMGKIKSPIVLGAGRVLAATPEDNIVEVKPEGTYEAEKKEIIEIPEFPFPYFRGKNGGVYIRKKMEDKKTKEVVEEDLLVYPYDFYLVSLINDPHHGATALFRVHFPQDGIKEFCVTLPDVLAKDRFRDGVSKQGMCPSNTQLENIMAYSNYWVNHYQKVKQARQGRVQFGWADDNQAFIVGDREIRKDEIRYSPPTISTADLVTKYSKAGDLEEWKKIANVYTKPGMEAHLFALLAGFASPLLSQVQKQGGVISLYSALGGTGKTTILRMINSIFGHPTLPMLTARDTENSTANRFGVLNHIAPTLDELTNAAPDKLSEFVYNYIHGRGKNRMTASANLERINTITWNGICIVTGNAVIEEKLRHKKEQPDGELRRIMEFALVTPHSMSKEESDLLFGKLNDNYGIAGEVYIQHLIGRRTAIQELYKTVQVKLDKTAGLRQREEFWSNMSSAILSAGVLTREAGVLDLDDDALRRLFEFTVDYLKSCMVKVVANSSAMEDVLGKFISEHYNDMLVIKGNPTAGLPEAPIREPKRRLLMRYEPDTKELSISSSQLRAFCIDIQVPFEELLTTFKKQHRCAGITRKRLGKGTPISANERVVVFTNIDNDVISDAKSIADTGHTGQD